MSDHIFLIGPMGAGKSTVGKQLARALSRPFFDIDHEIVKSTGADIQWIFDMEGEDGFRLRESKALDNLIQSERSAVIATGGGVVLQSSNRTAMSKAGRVIFLCDKKDQLYERTKRDKKRPLLQVDDRRAVIDSLFEQRDPLYRSVADFVFASGSVQIQRVVNEITDQLSTL
jgi:shikimate kinase